MSRMKLNCGHLAVRAGIGTGLAMDSLDYTWCYSCADANQVNDLMFAARFTGYVNEADRALVTWTGGKLGTIIRISYGSWQYRAGTKWRMRFVRVRDVHGNHWYGYASDSGDVVNVRRIRNAE